VQDRERLGRIRREEDRAERIALRVPDEFDGAAAAE